MGRCVSKHQTTKTAGKKIRRQLTIDRYSQALKSYHFLSFKAKRVAGEHSGGSYQLS